VTAAEDRITAIRRAHVGVVTVGRTARSAHTRLAGLIPVTYVAVGTRGAIGSTVLLHTPSVQTSLVHGLPSAQSAATTQDSQPGIGVFWQPLTGWHESVVQLFPSLQLSPDPAVHAPL